jgi:antibiotic biosynthesis monooxygenase (ABM) superfamily enzyme
MPATVRGAADAGLFCEASALHFFVTTEPMTESAPTLDATPATTPKPPSIHTRAIITWLAIFPLVSIGMLLLGPITDHWFPVLRALVLTALVVPLAVYVVVPQLMRAHGAVSRRRQR